jgi:phosphatidate cytidylyltransferase
VKTRVISGIVLGVLTVGLGLFGQISLGAVLALCSLIGYFEMTRALEVHRKGEKGECPGDLGLFLDLYALGLSDRVL